MREQSIEPPRDISRYVTSEIISKNRVYKLTLNSPPDFFKDDRKVILIKLFMSFIKEDEASPKLKDLAQSSKYMGLVEFRAQLSGYSGNDLQSLYKYFGPEMNVLQFINLLSDPRGFLYVYVDTVRTDDKQTIYKCYYYTDNNELETYTDDRGGGGFSVEKAYINIPKDVLDGLAIYFATPPPADQTLSQPNKYKDLESQALPRPNDVQPQTDEMGKVRNNPISNAFRNFKSTFFKKGGKKSIKRNNIRGSKSKLRRRSSVRRKKNTRRKHN